MYQAHTLVTIGGTLTEKVGADEIWQVGMRGSGFSDGMTPVNQGDLGTLALEVLRGPTGSGGGLEGIWQRADGHIPTTVKLNWCKAVNIAPDGTYSGEPAIAQIPGGKAGAAGPTAPSFLCAALSWTTGHTLGKATSGRSYVPNFGLGWTTGSQISAAAQADLLTWGASFWTCFDTTLMTVEFHPYVVSKYGVSNKITGIRVGDVWDVQRRRKDAVPETYVSAALTP